MHSGERPSAIYRAIVFVARAMDIAGTAVLVLMMLITVADVFLRYAFNRPIVGSTEITEYMMGCLVLGIPLTVLSGRAITMGLIVERLPKRAQAILDSLTGAIGLAAMVFLSWQLFRETVNAKATGLSSIILNIPSYPFYAVMGCAIALLNMAILANVMKNVAKGVKG
ncbi:MAG: TRAP transporter small permease [Thermodesulfobacteriota bacterium]